MSWLVCTKRIDFDFLLTCSRSSTPLHPTPLDSLYWSRQASWASCTANGQLDQRLGTDVTIRSEQTERTNERTHEQPNQDQNPQRIKPKSITIRTEPNWTDNSPIYPCVCVCMYIWSVSKPVVSICAGNQAHCLDLGMHGVSPVSSSFAPSLAPFLPLSLCFTDLPSRRSHRTLAWSDRCSFCRLQRRRQRRSRLAS